MEEKQDLPVPVIARARGYRLYTTRGTRLLDLYQNGGHGILGHRAYKLTSTLKNVISRGQIFDLPSVYTQRLIRAVSFLLPEYHSFRVYASLERLLQAAGGFLKREVKGEEFGDPALENWSSAGADASLWRPFLAPEQEQRVRRKLLLVPVLPFSTGGVPRVLCFKHRIPDNFYPSDTISPFLLAGTTRAVYDLRKYQRPAWSGDRKKIEVNWHSQGIYLSPRFSEPVYRIVYNDFLAGGILLSPRYPGPCCLPREVSPGEISKLRYFFEKSPERTL